MAQALENGWAKSMLAGYACHVTHFLNFCKQEQVPSALKFPADEFVLCAYAASDAGHISASTIQNRLSGLKAWHNAHGAPWNGGLRLQVIINGAKNLAPSSSKNPHSHQSPSPCCISSSMSSTLQNQWTQLLLLVHYSPSGANVASASSYHHPPRSFPPLPDLPDPSSFIPRVAWALTPLPSPKQKQTEVGKRLCLSPALTLSIPSRTYMPTSQPANFPGTFHYSPIPLPLVHAC